MADAVEMALWLKKWGYSPEQVQDFYPTPGTISTVMYYTGIHPMTGKRVNVTTDYHEKQLQRALLQYSRPENANLVREALRLAGREDLIGNSPECLVRPAFSGAGKSGYAKPHSKKEGAHHSEWEKKSSSRTVSKAADKRGRTGGARSKASNVKTPNARNAGIASSDVRRTKKSKLDRVFGENADRIRREADRVSATRKSGAKKRKNSR